MPLHRGAGSRRRRIAIANDYAPEHLHAADARAARAGSTRSQQRGLGVPRATGRRNRWATTARGTNHVLPTYGYARAYSGLSVLGFQKRITVQELTADGPARARARRPRRWRELEGLDAHAAARRACAWRRCGASAPHELAHRARAPGDRRAASLRACGVGAGARAPARQRAALARRGRSHRRPASTAIPSRSRTRWSQRLAALYGVPPDMLLVGRGSDEAIDLLVRSFLPRRRRTRFSICPPTFGMYARGRAHPGRRRASRCRCSASAASRSTSTRVLAAVHADTSSWCSCARRTIPTGNCSMREAIAAHLRAQLDGRALLVVDEAYIEFADARQRSRARLDAHSEPRRAAHAVQGHALAGARCGALLAHAEIIALLRKVIPPYAHHAADHRGRARARSQPQALARCARASRTDQAERARMARRAAALADACARVWPSDANFLLVEFDDAGRGASSARAPPALLVRDMRAQPALAQALRITIGTRRTERSPARERLAMSEHARNRSCSSIATAR